jgi:hypothetical protein
MTTCKHFQKDSTCALATRMAKGVPIQTTIESCEICSQQERPQAINGMTLTLAYSVTKNPKLRAMFQAIGPCGNSVPCRENYIVGTELKKLISWFPLGKKQCRYCKSLEARMNKWGPETCEQKREFIVKKLMLNAKRLGIPTTELLLNVLLNRAIRNAKNR